MNRLRDISQVFAWCIEMIAFIYFLASIVVTHMVLTRVDEWLELKERELELKEQGF